jgi:arylformamidase
MHAADHDDHRVQFDFEVDFSNGGGIQGQGFRLDIDGDDIEDEQLAAYIVRDLRLLMVGEVRILDKQIVRERHKRSARTDPDGAADDGRTRIDLSHVVEDGLVTYKGLPAPVVCDFLSREASREHYAPGTEFQIGTVQLCSNTGTYVDSPFHRTDVYFGGHPFLTEDAAAHLVEQRALLVGIDSLNVDDTTTGERPVHSTLLAAGIPICEHLTNLAALPTEGFRFSAVPVMMKGMGTFPVRSYAVV